MQIRRPFSFPGMNALALLAVTSLLLGGCSWFSRNKDRTEYQGAAQTRPLEVPPDLDSPAGSSALTIPNASGPTSGVREAGILVLGRPADASAASPTTISSATVATTSNSLNVSDSAASTWRRVGLALERIDGTTILSRDEAAMSYDIRTTGQTVQKAGWFKRAITFGKATKTVSNPVSVQLRVSSDGDNSTVQVEGGDSAADAAAVRSLIESLRSRLN
ncbi:MAG: hypothetical protein WBP11_12210 [Dokdonella sp.]